jgi:phosphate transport system permease protein
MFWAAAVLTMAILAGIIFYILANGLPGISWTFLSTAPAKMGREGGIFPMIVGTIILTILAIVVATPVGVGTAIYLTEYTRETMATKIIRFGAESLAAIPSIIFGLFGFLFFVIQLGWGWSILSGSLTLAAMILPTIIRTAEESLRSVPISYREISYALGASRWQTVTKAVLPTALPGIVTGIVLSVGRSIGETAAVIFTAGSSLRLPASLFDPVRTLPVHFYILAREGISMQKAYSTAAILVLAVLLIDSLAYYLLYRFTSRATRGTVRR